MEVVKRNNQKEPVYFDKIRTRLEKLINLDGIRVLNCDPAIIIKQVANSITNNIKTSDIDKLTAEISAYMITIDPDYDILAAR